MLGEEQLLTVNDGNKHHPRAELEGCLHRIRTPLPFALPNDQTVDHRLNRVFFILIQLEFFRKVMNLTVNPYPDIARLAQVHKNLLVLPLAVADERRHNQDAAALGEVVNRIHNLLHRLGGDFPTALGAVGMTDPGEEQPQVIVNFGHRAHGGTRVFTRSFLVDGNGRAQTFDVVDIRFFHPAQKLAGICRERLHISALAFSINGIKGKRAFPRAGNTGDNDELITGDGDVYILQVVFAGAFNHDGIQRHFSDLPI